MRTVGLLAVAAALVCIASYAVWVAPSQSASEILRMPSEEAKRYWVSRVETAGADGAYEEFKRVYREAAFSAQHPAAHLFGAVLFEREGLDGFSVCDEDFSFGCFHGYFGRAVGEQGTDIVDELDRECIEKYGPLGTGCQHGIGHGIMEFMGDDIDSALALCSLTTQVEPLFGCTSGVFMEYHMPIRFSEIETTQEPRPFDVERPAKSCEGVEKKYRTSCYFEIGLWWKQVLGGDFERVGALCGAVVAQEERDACFLGLGGVVAPSVDFDIKNTISTCERMPTAEGSALCAAGAAWTFWAQPERRAESEYVCAMLRSEDAQEFCRERAKLIKE